MGAIISRQIKRTSTVWRRLAWPHLVSSVLLAAAAGWLAHYGLDRPWFVAVAAALVLVAEVLPRRKGWPRSLVPAIPLMVTGVAAVVLVALSTKAVSQVAVVGLYALWRWWRLTRPQVPASFTELLLLLALSFEAIFLASAYWQAPAWACLVAVWVCAYGLVYEGLSARGERLARVLAATWALIAVEVSWVFLTWLVTYVLYEQYLVVPQAALILTGLAYCFGGIYLSQRQQALTRGRLAEYLLIALLLVVIVATSTPWRGTL